MTYQFCTTCGKPLGGGRFCSICGAEIPGGGSPIASVPPFSKRTALQSNVARKAVHEMKLIGFGNLLPYKDWLADKPWNLVWVRWFVGIAFFPLMLMFFASTAN